MDFSKDERKVWRRFEEARFRMRDCDLLAESFVFCPPIQGRGTTNCMSRSQLIVVYTTFTVISAVI